jgi:ABC-type transport system involved in multi-copper enzyme maturation permease subunit
MPTFRETLGLPLLARELTELSARRRTYVMRVAYAVVLYGVTLWSYWHWLGQFRPNSFDALGQGKPLFEQLVRWQFWGIFLFLPVMTCGAITGEKERQTLQLLKLTKLGGWTILFEKLGSRLVAMAMFLLLPLPLASVAYSLGGIDTTDLLKAVFVLSITAVQIGSFALLCSAWFRTTAGAMLGAYLIGALGMFWGSWLLRLVLLGALNLGLHQLPWPGLDDYSREWFENSIRTSRDYRPFSGPWVFGCREVEPEYLPIRYLTASPTGQMLILCTQGSRGAGAYFIDDVSIERGRQPRPVTRWLSSMVAGRVIPTSLSDAVICSLPLVLSALVCLLLARWFLWRRAEAREWPLLQTLFAVADRMFAAINRNPLTRGISLGRVERDLPTDRPIAWRETHHRLIGRPEHLARILLALEVPLLLWLLWRGAVSPLQLGSELPTIWLVLWLVMMLIVIAVSTGIIPLERSRQTFDVLLTSPLTASEIVRQKLAGVRRLIAVLCVPLLTLLVFQSVWNHFVVVASGHDRGVLFVSGGQTAFGVDPIRDPDENPQEEATQWLMLLGRIAAIGIYLPLVGWIGFQFGLRMKNQFQAVIATAATVTFPCASPWLIQRWIGLLSNESPWLPFSRKILSWVQWIDPGWVLFQADASTVGSDFPMIGSDVLPAVWFPLLFHFLTVGGMLWLVRRSAPKKFSHFVRRLEPANHRHIRLAVTEPTQILSIQEEKNDIPISRGYE